MEITQSANGRVHIKINLAPQAPLELDLPGISSSGDQWDQAHSILLAQLVEEVRGVRRVLERKGK